MLLMHCSRLFRRVWALLPFGVAGDKRRLGPRYYLDPNTRIIHLEGRSCCVTSGRRYSSLTKATNAGGDPCAQCLQDWESIVVSETCRSNSG